MGSAIDALRADRAALLKIGAGLSDTDWAAPSGCPGWSVKDVIAHMGALFWAAVDPSQLPDAAGRPAEAAQEIYVEARRALGPSEVLADYESVSAAAMDVLAGFADQDFEVPLGDLGTYPASALPTAFCFDHYVHIRDDLFPPRGALTGTPPPSDELRLAPTLDWIETALPQQNGDVLAAMTGMVEIVVTGPGGRTIRVGSGAVAGQVTCDGPTFVRRITQRAPWGETQGVDAGSLDVLRSLHVF